MLRLFLLLFTMPALAQVGPFYKSVSYYDGLGEKFRVEVVSMWPKCVEKILVKRVYLDKSNELREIFYWDHTGILHEGGKLNKSDRYNRELHAVVDLFFRDALSSGNTCEVKPETIEPVVEVAKPIVKETMKAIPESEPAEESDSPDIEVLEVYRAEGELH